MNHKTEEYLVGVLSGHDPNWVDKQLFAEFFTSFQSLALFFLIRDGLGKTGDYEENLNNLIKFWRVNMEAKCKNLLDLHTAAMQSIAGQMVVSEFPTSSEIHQKLDKTLADVENMIRASLEQDSEDAK
jgi:hypothetical protein|tara:strand:+ start:3121 stop:3504 length:384 start_codon:yes stop_codon:yes gene_type:complete